MDYLAHISQADQREQTLCRHCRDAQRLCAEAGAKIGLRNTAALTGLLHDAGKAKREFQDYLQSGDASLKGKINHATAGAKYVYEKYYINGGPMEQFTAQLISLAVCSHHGGLIDCLAPDGGDVFTGRMQPQKEIFYEESIRSYKAECANREELDALFQKAVRESESLIPKIGAVCRGQPDSAMYFMLGLLERYLFSCLIDADRYDTFCFETEKDPFVKTGQAGTPALWRELYGRLEEYIKRYPQKTEIDRLRTEISLCCRDFAKSGTGVYQLFVPTGGGKTMSSLRFALRHALETGKERIFYIIPFTTIIDQNAAEIRKALQCLGGDYDVILEHHSNLVVDDNDEEEYRLLTQRWDSPIILTTMVQFLNTLFLGKTQSARRMHSLADSVLIFDEIQAIPVKCIHMFNTAINFLSAVCGATVVLCTATQPQLAKTQYPLRLGEPGNIVPDYERKFAQFKRTRIVPSLIPGGYSSAALTGFVLDKMDLLSSALTVMNTKTAAKKLYRRLYEENELLPEKEKFRLYYLSTGLCPRHRLAVLKEIRELLKSPESGRVICVSTQMIEAGVDLSFDCVIRSLAGLDSVAQAAGRCNRHGEAACREVYVINSAEENLEHLPEIREAQDAARRVLDEYKADSARFDGDLLSPKAIERFYFYYYYTEAGKMSYCVKKQEQAKVYKALRLYDLLSQNAEAFQNYSENHNRQRPPLVLKQSFGTAGELFRVIESSTIGVLVPFECGKEIIAALGGSGADLKERQRLIKEAQQYSVNLFEYEIKLLDKQHALRNLGECGVTVLEEGYYSKRYGVTMEKQVSGEEDIKNYML